MNSRRDFIQDISLGGFGMALPFSLQNRIAERHQYKEMGAVGVLPVACITDAFNLAFSIVEIDNFSRIALTQNLSLKLPGNKGCMANFSIEKNTELASVLKELSAKKEDVKSQSLLSLIFGSLVFSQLKNNIGPVYSKFSADQEEMRMCHDAYLLNTVSGKKIDHAPSKDAMEKLILELAPRSAERIHTFIADPNDGPGWLEKMVAYRNRYREDAVLFAEALISPAKGKVKKYIEDENLYHATDPIIQLARLFQRAERVTGQEVRRALENPGESLYAGSVAAGVSDILLADQFIRGEITTL